MTYQRDMQNVVADLMTERGRLAVENARLLARARDFSEAARYLAGCDVAGWEPHMRPAEVLAKVGLTCGPKEGERG